MDVRKEVAEFLRSRRNRITPQQAGLTAWGERRRVPGLRREEVALLAGVSVEYYIRLERGNVAGVSESVLDSISRALLLDEAEHAHLHDLARLATPRAPQKAASGTIRPALQWMLDGMTQTASFILNARSDILAFNRLGEALYAPIFTAPGGPNVARFLFLDPAATDFFPAWDQVTHESAAMLRAAAAVNPSDIGLTQLIGELSARSELFAKLWATHDVRLHRTGVKAFHHPTAGALTLSYESLNLASDPGLRLTTYAAEPGSPSAEGLTLLGSWMAPAPSVKAQRSA